LYYPSKVLLFGEHSVFYCSDTLAIPFNNYFGKWDYGDKIDKRLLKIIPALSADEIDIGSFEDDIHNHLFFNSNIPLEYGLGSSAALSAAILDNYSVKIQNNYTDIQKSLAKIESHFHGTSSGTDALVSFIKKPVFTSNHKVKLLESNPLPDLNIKVAMIDSGIKRSAKDYITLFRDKVDKKNIPIVEVSEVVNSCIKGCLTSTLSLPLINELSKLQFNYLSEFIPENIKTFWSDGLRKEDYCTKLCGAGGGGLFLIFSTEDISENSSFPIISLN